MKTILYMGISVNGYIAKENGDSEWTSDEDLKGFMIRVKTLGILLWEEILILQLQNRVIFHFPMR